MANTTKRATRTKAVSTAQKVAKVADEATVEAVKSSEPVSPIDDHTIVTVKNGVHGYLIYKSTRNAGYIVEWNEFGEEQQMEYGELVVMRGSQRRFFEDNWVIIEDEAVLKKLGVERYYKNALTADNFDSVYSMSPDEIIEKVSAMSNGLKDSVRIRAQELMASGKLDSLGVIKALNEALDCDLTETI